MEKLDYIRYEGVLYPVKKVKKDFPDVQLENHTIKKDIKIIEINLYNDDELLLTYNVYSNFIGTVRYWGGGGFESFKLLEEKDKRNRVHKVKSMLISEWTGLSKSKFENKDHIFEDIDCIDTSNLSKNIYDIEIYNISKYLVGLDSIEFEGDERAMTIFI